MNSVWRGLDRAAMAGILLVLSGCAALPGGDKTISITSEPTGATVYASGAQVGETPLKIVPDHVFPPRFVGMSYRAEGTLTVKKPGCAEYSRQVNDYVLSRDIHVQLKCDPHYRAPVAAHPGHPPVKEPATAGSVEFRLRRLEALRKDGLITDQEYNAIRKRILDGL